MKHASLKTFYSYTLLLILLSAMVGHKVHIYSEDPSHFAALCGDLLPDNGADSEVVERCVVDNFVFFSCVCVDAPLFESHFTSLWRRSIAATSVKLAGDVRLVALRAPPAVV